MTKDPDQPNPKAQGDSLDPRVRKMLNEAIESGRRHAEKYITVHGVCIHREVWEQVGRLHAGHGRTKKKPLPRFPSWAWLLRLLFKRR